MKILQKWTLVNGYTTFEKVFVRIGNESFSYDIEIESMTLRGHLGEELERLAGKKGVEKLSTDSIINSYFFITRHSQIPYANLSQ